MYQFIAIKTTSAENAYFYYYRSGLHMMQVLEPIIIRKFGDIGNVDTFLDFACGYGRLTRFLVQRLDPKKNLGCGYQTRCC